MLLELVAAGCRCARSAAVVAPSVDRLRTWDVRRPAVPAGRDLDRANASARMRAARASVNMHGRPGRLHHAHLRGVRRRWRPAHRPHRRRDLYEPDAGDRWSTSRPEELVELCERAGSDHGWARRLARAARARTLGREHTFDHRVAVLESSCWAEASAGPRGLAALAGPARSPLRRLARLCRPGPRLRACSPLVGDRPRTVVVARQPTPPSRLAAAGSRPGHLGGPGRVVLPPGPLRRPAAAPDAPRGRRANSPPMKFRSRCARSPPWPPWGNTWPAARVGYAWSRRLGLPYFVAVQHGAADADAPPLPRGARAVRVERGRRRVLAVRPHDVRGRRGRLPAALGGRRGHAAGHRDPTTAPTFLGQLHGAELPRARLAAAAATFCRATSTPPTVRTPASATGRSRWRRTPAGDAAGSPSTGPASRCASWRAPRSSACSPPACSRRPRRGVPAWVDFPRPARLAGRSSGSVTAWHRGRHRPRQRPTRPDVEPAAPSPRSDAEGLLVTADPLRHPGPRRLQGRARARTCARSPASRYRLDHRAGTRGRPASTSWSRPTTTRSPTVARAAGAPGAVPAAGGAGAGHHRRPSPSSGTPSPRSTARPTAARRRDAAPGHLAGAAARHPRRVRVAEFAATGVDSMVGVVPQAPFLWRAAPTARGPGADYDVDHRPARQDLTGDRPALPRDRLALPHAHRGLPASTTTGSAAGSGCS